MSNKDEALLMAIVAMKSALSNQGTMLLSDPPQSAWKFYGCENKLKEAFEACKEALEQRDLYSEIKEGFDALKQPAQEPECSNHPDAPHGFCRNASHSAGRYVCECEGWEAGQQAQEPVSLGDFDNMTKAECVDYIDYLRKEIDLLRFKDWVGLSDEEIEKIDDETILATEFARAIEQALRNKNGY